MSEEVKTYRLTNSQMYMYAVHQQGFGKGAMLCGSIIIPESRTEEELQHAANEVYRINDALRTRITKDEDGTLKQFFAPFEEKEFEVIRTDSLEEVDRIGEKMSGTDFVIDEVHDLCEFKIVIMPEAYGVILRIHHIISDAWTLLMMGNQFIKILNGETPEAYSFSEFLESEEKYLTSKRREKDLEFFRKQMEILPEDTHISNMPLLSPKKKWIENELDEGLTEAIKRYTDEYKLSAYPLFVTAVGAWISCEIGKNPLFVGSVALNRAGYREKNMAGFLATSAPLLLDLDFDASFADNVKKVNESVFASFRHQKSAQAACGTVRRPYDIWINYQTAALDSGIEARIKQYPAEYISDIMILEIIGRGDGRMNFQFEYNVKFPDKKAKNFCSKVPALLYEGLKDESRTLGEVTEAILGEGACSKKSKKLFKSILKQKA